MSCRCSIFQGPYLLRSRRVCTILGYAVRSRSFSPAPRHSRAVSLGGPVKDPSSPLRPLSSTTTRLLRRLQPRRQRRRKGPETGEKRDFRMSSVVEERLEALGLKLPPPSEPKGSYVQYVRTGSLLFTAGHISLDANGKLTSGMVGSAVTVEEAKAGAVACALALLATIKAAIGSLDRVRRVVKLVGFVASGGDFSQQPQVVNGASDLFVAVFGEAVGRHARSAVGVASLPLGASVEVEAVIEVAPELDAAAAEGGDAMF